MKYAEITYEGLHSWVRHHKVYTGVCQHCGDRPPWRKERLPKGKTRNQRGTQFANISGEYRQDPDDYIELCLPCHKKFDAEK